MRYLKEASWAMRSVLVLLSISMDNNEVLNFIKQQFISVLNGYGKQIHPKYNNLFELCYFVQHKNSQAPINQYNFGSDKLKFDARVIDNLDLCTRNLGVQFVFLGIEDVIDALLKAMSLSMNGYDMHLVNLDKDPNTQKESGYLINNNIWNSHQIDNALGIKPYMQSGATKFILMHNQGYLTGLEKLKMHFFVNLEKNYATDSSWIYVLYYRITVA